MKQFPEFQINKILNHCIGQRCLLLGAAFDRAAKERFMMKLMIVCVACLLAGCARYYTAQTDISYDKDQAHPNRAITTKVSTYTLWSARSEISKSKTLQTDKTQSSAVGSVSQSATNNVVEALQAIDSIIGKLPK